MKKMGKRFRAVLAGVLSAVLVTSVAAVMPAAPVRALTASGQEEGAVSRNAYGIEIESVVPTHFYGDTEDATETAEITVICPDEWKEKIRYQWMYEDYDDMTGNETYINIEGATERSFRPTLDLLEKQERRWFVCRVTVEGDSDFFEDSEIVYYRKLNDCIDLTKTVYDDTIDISTSYMTYVRKVQASADAKALHISGELAENVWEITIMDARGRYFTFNRDVGLTKFDLETEGNYFYVFVYYMSELPKSIGIATIEERPEFVKKPFQLYAEATNGDSTFQPGDAFDISKMYVLLFYNDGTYEQRDASALSWEADQVIHYGENKVKITDKETGLSITTTIKVSYMPQWKEKPAETFYAGEIQRASVQMPEVEGEEPLCCLWLIRDSQGEWAAEIEDDTETEIIIPQDLSSGRYQLFCFYYTKTEGFQEYNYLQTEFRVRASASGVTPAPSQTPSVSEKPAPSAVPSASPAPKQKKPGTVMVSLKKHKKAVTVKIKRSKTSSGCQIMYADNKAFTKKKNTVSTKKTSYKIKGLKKNQKIYIRVRAYREEKKKKQYGKWSKVLYYKA